eukprot:m.252180 g.252180  ORF g.252180 m.252180 type:complete len:128 (+) comp26512_c0_seq14:3106-3489(+)
MFARPCSRALPPAASPTPHHDIHPQADQCDYHGENYRDVSNRDGKEIPGSSDHGRSGKDGEPVRLPGRERTWWTEILRSPSHATLWDGQALPLLLSPTPTPMARGRRCRGTTLEPRHTTADAGRSGP